MEGQPLRSLSRATPGHLQSILCLLIRRRGKSSRRGQPQSTSLAKIFLFPGQSTSWRLSFMRRIVPHERSRNSIGRIFARSFESAPSILKRNLFVPSFCVTVVKVHSKESEIRVSNKVHVAVDLNLPAFEHRQVEHWPSKMSWSDAMRNFAHARESY